MYKLWEKLGNMYQAKTTRQQNIIDEAPCKTQVTNGTSITEHTKKEVEAKLEAEVDADIIKSIGRSQDPRKS